MLDTNAWLDLHVFADASLATLADAIARGDVRPVMDVRILDEIARVLRYPVLRLDDADANRHFDDIGRQSRTVECFPPAGLPRCRDPDDQKFLEVAACVGARWLLTRDDDLLRLDRRMQRAAGVRVLTPRDWCEASGGQMSKR